VGLNVASLFRESSGSHIVITYDKMARWHDWQRERFQFQRVLPGDCLGWVVFGQWRAAL
jgi:hypothetical protein